MRQVAAAFQKGKKALIGYITAGYPDMEATPRIAAAM